jgi:putative SOS response-associated peptidase YedK
LLAFAGLWEKWKGDGKIIESCAIIVGDPDPTVRAVHDRQPFVIAKEDQNAWLSRGLTDTDRIIGLLRRPEPETLAFHKVSRAVGNVRNQGPELMQPYYETS